MRNFLELIEKQILAIYNDAKHATLIINKIFILHYISKKIDYFIYLMHLFMHLY